MKQFKQQVPPGTVIAGRYRVLETLGLGGMACVYLAEDLKTRSYVALKLMRDEIADDPEFIRRFATEARAAASLDHPNIVRVLDYGQDHMTRYIVQEYVHGLTLKELIQRQGSLEWQLAIPLMIQIALALVHAHRRGIIHRDLKPQNILVTEDMVAKVTDFGIARASNANTITLTGGVAFGSVHYFSPEQARGGEVTDRSDLYSLGIMLYEMLTGELPFDGESSVAVAIKQLQDMPLRPTSLNPRLPKALDDIIFKAIQKLPERRYPSAAEFVDELERFLREPNASFGLRPHEELYMDRRPTSALHVSGDLSDFDRMREIEAHIQRRRWTKLRDLLIGLILLMILLVGVFYGFHSVLKNFQDISRQVENDEVVIGRYIGRPVDEVLAELKQRFGEQVPVEVLHQKNATVEPGMVFKQEPEPEYKVSAKDLKLKLLVSEGQELYQVPDVRGKTADEAKQILTAAGFTPMVHKEWSDQVKRDHVIEQKPEANSQAAQRTTVYLKISGGPSQVQLPQIVGLTWVQAAEVLKSLGLDIQGRSAVSNGAGENIDLPEDQRVILTASVEAGAMVEAGASIQVTYGTQKDFERMQNPTIQLPDFVGLDWETLQARLAENPDLRAATQIVSRSSNPNQRLYRVINQNPKPGTIFSLKDDRLTLEVGLVGEPTPIFPGRNP